MKKKEQVILLENSRLGKIFEIKEVKRGFVVNHLLPQKKVLLYNHNNFS
jgi:ribosomal protein L9